MKLRAVTGVGLQRSCQCKREAAKVGLLSELLHLGCLQWSFGFMLSERQSLGLRLAVSVGQNQSIEQLLAGGCKGAANRRSKLQNISP